MKIYKTKKRKATNRKALIVLITFLMGVISIGINGEMTKRSIDRVSAQEVVENASMGVVVAQNELSIEDIVLNMIEEAGLNKYKAWSIIDCESSWKADAVAVEPNGTYSLGLWQINSIHKDINNTDKLNYVKATKWAIQKRLNDGNWSAWSCN